MDTTLLKGILKPHGTMQGFGLIYFIAKFLVIDNQTARDRNPSFGGTRFGNGTSCDRNFQLVKC